MSCSIKKISRRMQYKSTHSGLNHSSMSYI
nr:MAG TPA: hypothetical protein [Caudoviricetes sp.]